MMNVRNIAALLALSALPACSMFGGGGSRQASNTAPASSQSYAYQQPQQQSYSSYSQSPELSQDTIRQVQTKLQQDGMYRGRVDGVWGPQTQTAVRQFQQQNNLNASGSLDQDTLSALNVGSNQNYGSSQQPQSQRYGSNTNTPPNNTTPNNNASSYNPPANTSTNTNTTNTQR
jgi:peptidoglycan hydrolase-like protein with peptidoglycan-binding domain